MQRCCTYKNVSETSIDVLPYASNKLLDLKLQKRLSIRRVRKTAENVTRLDFHAKTRSTRNKSDDAGCSDVKDK